MRETAAPLADALGILVRTDPALRERCFRVFEGGPVDGPLSGPNRHDRVIDAQVILYRRRSSPAFDIDAGVSLADNPLEPDLAG